MRSNNITELFKSKQGKIIISIILGLGLASLFRQVCKGSQCIIVKGPRSDEIKNNFYKIDDDCYKYSQSVVECENGN